MVCNEAKHKIKSSSELQTRQKTINKVHELQNEFKLLQLLMGEDVELTSCCWEHNSSKLIINTAKKGIYSLI